MIVYQEQPPLGEDTAQTFRKTAFRVMAVLLCIGLFLSAGCTVQLPSLGSHVTYPHIVPVTDAPPPPLLERSFPFKNRTCTIAVQVSGPVYAGAKTAEKEITVYGNVSESEWLPEAYLRIMNDPAQEGFYASLLDRFKKIRARDSLDSDEYLELMASFVQSLTYETRNLTNPKFPIETFVEGIGDCDDKSLLLAGMLSREGYRVALLRFGPELHMAVGVADGTAGYRDTGYGYLETTNGSYVGIVPDHLRGGVVLTSQPLVIPAGNGTITFGKSAQITYIKNALARAREHAAALESRVVSCSNSVEAEQAVLDSLKADMNQLKDSGNVEAYNSRVPQYNAKVADYNLQLGNCRSLAAEHKEYAEINNYIIGHTFDREGTYTWVTGHIPK